MTDVAALGLERRLEQHREELTRHCHRILGSKFEAEDAVQETMVRAWRAFNRYEGRATLRSWLYRIATNVCRDMLQSRTRRALPVDLGQGSPGDAAGSEPQLDHMRTKPIPQGRAVPPIDDPAELTVSRETISGAFVAALQHLPPRQRAVLILREVLRWKAREVADLLGTSVASANSALQRARAAFASRDLTSVDQSHPKDKTQQALLARYLDAFERFDIESLVSILHEEFTMSTSPAEGRTRRTASTPEGNIDEQRPAPT
jgi:RNA polymerase sigma-70 factor (ECF subfamily)